MEVPTKGSALFIEFTPAHSDNMFLGSFGQYLLLNQILVNDTGDNPGVLGIESMRMES